MTMTDVFAPIATGLMSMFFGALTIIGTLVFVAVVAGLIYVWVRYMLSVTRAARVYADLHGADAAAARSAALANEATVSAAASASKPAAAKPAPAKPATKSASAKSTSQPKG
ncbi:MAG TPA: hypothetical protein PK781_03860 [Terrimesophilobacter sp.]|nr:hypothetical protein [Terrimesophilobacter sp.]HRP99578.1 hypothetical protein [Terrimesophilobacter sp.]